jgi:hypothetical protein
MSIAATSTFDQTDLESTKSSLNIDMVAEEVSTSHDKNAAITITTEPSSDSSSCSPPFESNQFGDDDDERSNILLSQSSSTQRSPSPRSVATDFYESIGSPRPLMEENINNNNNIDSNPENVLLPPPSSSSFLPLKRSFTICCDEIERDVLGEITSQLGIVNTDDMELAETIVEFKGQFERIMKPLHTVLEKGGDRSHPPSSQFTLFRKLKLQLLRIQDAVGDLITLTTTSSSSPWQGEKMQDDDAKTPSVRFSVESNDAAHPAEEMV